MQFPFAVSVWVASCHLSTPFLSFLFSQSKLVFLWVISAINIIVIWQVCFQTPIFFNCLVSDMATKAPQRFPLCWTLCSPALLCFFSCYCRSEYSSLFVLPVLSWTFVRLTTESDHVSACNDFCWEGVLQVSVFIFLFDMQQAGLFYCNCPIL